MIARLLPAPSTTTPTGLGSSRSRVPKPRRSGARTRCCRRGASSLPRSSSGCSSRLAAGFVAGGIGAISAFYGAAVVFVPGALMARGATSRLSSLSPAISAASMLCWSFIKIGLSVAMLVLAARIVPGVVWPALLAAMVLGMQSYWFALLWRGRADGASQG